MVTMEKEPKVEPSNISNGGKKSRQKQRGKGKGKGNTEKKSSPILGKLKTTINQGRRQAKLFLRIFAFSNNPGRWGGKGKG